MKIPSIAGILISLALPFQICAQTPKVFFGSLHSHTSYSDGSGTPDEAFKAAKAAKLDFFAITEHNHHSAESDAGERTDGILISNDNSLYNGPQATSLISAAGRNSDTSFVALYGQEVSSISKGNHVNIFDVDQVIKESDVPNGKFNKLVNWLQDHNDSQGLSPIMQLNHPSNSLRAQSLEYGMDDFGPEANWIKEIGAYACTIEILNGPGLSKETGLSPGAPFEDDYLFYLNKGFRLSLSADQDNHWRNWGTLTTARTGVIANELTKPALMAAIRARHTYATEDKNLRVIITVNGKLCGDVIHSIPAVNTPLDIAYSIVDDDEPEAEYDIDIFSDDKIGGDVAKIVETVGAEGNNPLSEMKHVSTVPFKGVGQYLFFRIKQTDEDDQHQRVWTAPVWFANAAPGGGHTPFNDMAGLPAGSEVIPPEEAGFVASKNSKIYHRSSDCSAAALIKPENRITGRQAKIGRTLHVGCPNSLNPAAVHEITSLTSLTALSAAC